MTDLEPGKMRGKLSLREHVADVLINYTPQTFAIRYEDSVNLAYDGSLIHKNYNSWVRRLEKEIYRQSLASPSS
jgi:hypothetical protein